MIYTEKLISINSHGIRRNIVIFSEIKYLTLKCIWKHFCIFLRALLQIPNIEFIFKFIIRI